MNNSTVNNEVMNRAVRLVALQDHGRVDLPDPAEIGALTPTLRSVADLYAKLERERYRLFHCKNDKGKADHLYNFCVTASSLRDYFLNELGLDAADPAAKKYYDCWKKSPELEAARDIADCSKHMVLSRRVPTTIEARPSEGTVVEIYETEEGRQTHVLRPVCDLQITLSDGREIGTYALTETVINYWTDFLARCQIKLEQQAFEDLSGADDESTLARGVIIREMLT